jgi:hypothetical protein
MHCSGSSGTNRNDATNAGEGGMGATAGSAGTSAGTGGNTGGVAGAGGSAGGAAGSAGIAGATAGKGGAAGGAGVAGAGAIAGGGAAGLDAGAAGVATDGGEGGSMTAGGTGGACAGDIAEDRRHGRRARSSGFSGTDAQYGELYNLACFSIDDCIEPCLERGGTETMCFAGECVDSTEDYCLPATVWSNLPSLLVEGSDPYTDAAVLVLVGTPYRDFLLVDDFKLEVPASAEIKGITVTVRRAGGGADEAFDYAVRLLKGGVMGESDRATATPWNAPPFENVDYGGPTDLWNETWTPADVNAADFGVALAAGYTQTAGNGRAYVDIVYVTVSYSLACE